MTVQIVAATFTGTSGSSVSNSGGKQDNSPVEVEWPVTKGDFEKLQESMILEEVPKMLGPDSLRYNPRSKDAMPGPRYTDLLRVAGGKAVHSVVSRSSVTAPNEALQEAAATTRVSLGFQPQRGRRC